MEYNALIIRHLTIDEVSVDFSDYENIKEVVQAEKLYTVHTEKTQELSKKLGIHLLGFIDRDGDDINNQRACDISGYDYIGSFMLLCKSDNKFNPLPLEPYELERLYVYLTSGKILPIEEPKGNGFFDKYKIPAVFPNLPVKQKVYYKAQFPYVILYRYELNNASEALKKELDTYLKILSVHYKEKDGLYISNDGSHYLKCYMEKYAFNILIQAKGEEALIISHPHDVIHKGFLNENKKEGHKSVDPETTSEEAFDFDYEDYEPEYYVTETNDDDALMTALNYVLEYEVDIKYPAHPTRISSKGIFAIPFLNVLFKDTNVMYMHFLGKIFELESFSSKQQMARFYLDLGKKKEEFVLSVGQIVELPIDMINFKNEHVVGTLKLTLSYVDFGECNSERKVHVEEKLTIRESGVDQINEQGDILITLDEAKDEIKDIATQVYTSGFVSDDKKYVVVKVADGFENKEDTFFYLVKENQIITLSRELTKNGEKADFVTKISLAD